MKLKIINTKGLHARASAKLAETAEQFRSRLEVSYDGMNVDARSIMGLMMLGAAKGAEIELHADGEDAEAAKTAIAALIDDYFGEGG